MGTEELSEIRTLEITTLLSLAKLFHVSTQCEPVKITQEVFQKRLDAGLNMNKFFLILDRVCDMLSNRM